MAVRRIKLGREDGVAMTEFALILPVFVLIIAGILSFGRVFFYWIEANHLANETARWAVVDRNPYAPATLQLHARNASTAEFQSNVDVCIDFPQPDGTPGTTPTLGGPVRVASRSRSRSSRSSTQGRSRSGATRRCASSASPEAVGRRRRTTRSAHLRRRGRGLCTP